MPTKPEFDCPMRKAIAEEFGTEKLEASAWADTLCLQRPTGMIHTKLGEGENLCPFFFSNDTLQPVGRLQSFHSIGALRAHVNRVHLSVTPPGPINPYIN